MEIKIVYEEKDLSDYIDHRFSVIKDGKEMCSVWMGDPLTYWKDGVGLIEAYIKGWLNNIKPNIKE